MRTLALIVVSALVAAGLVHAFVLAEVAEAKGTLRGAIMVAEGMAGFGLIFGLGFFWGWRFRAAKHSEQPPSGPQ